MEEQSLVKWASFQLHDSESLARMVDVGIRRTLSSKAVSQFADIVSLSIQGCVMKLKEHSGAGGCTVMRGHHAMDVGNKRAGDKQICKGTGDDDQGKKEGDDGNPKLYKPTGGRSRSKRKTAALEMVFSYVQGRFLIHGMWPASKNDNLSYSSIKSNAKIKDHLVKGTASEDLHPYSFNPDPQMRQNMVTYWPNLLGFASHEDLWRHEWEMHGIFSHWLCQEYFERVLAKGIEMISGQHNLSAALARSRNKSVGACLTVGSLTDEMKREFGGKPKVIVEGDNLKEIRFMFRLDFETIFDQVDIPDRKTTFTC